MATTATARSDDAFVWSPKNKVGLALAAFYGAVDIPSAAAPAPGGDVGPPMAILIVCSILGVAALASKVVAWRKGSF